MGNISEFEVLTQWTETLSFQEMENYQIFQNQTSAHYKDVWNVLKIWSAWNWKQSSVKKKFRFAASDLFFIISWEAVSGDQHHFHIWNDNKSLDYHKKIWLILTFVLLAFLNRRMDFLAAKHQYSPHEEAVWLRSFYVSRKTNHK